LGAFKHNGAQKRRINDRWPSSGGGSKLSSFGVAIRRGWGPVYENLNTLKRSWATFFWCREEISGEEGLKLFSLRKGRVKAIVRGKDSQRRLQKTGN